MVDSQTKALIPEFDPVEEAIKDFGIYISK